MEGQRGILSHSAFLQKGGGQKAYDTTWIYGILKDIHKLGLRSRLPTFIENSLADRTMQVRVGSSLSDLNDQEQGVPKGGTLSTTLLVSKLIIL